VPRKNNQDKAFDCVTFKREAQARIYERIQGLSPQLEIEYFRKAAEQGPLADAWKAAQDRARCGQLGPQGESGV